MSCISKRSIKIWRKKSETSSWKSWIIKRNLNCLQNLVTLGKENRKRKESRRALNHVRLPFKVLLKFLILFKKFHLVPRDFICDYCGSGFPTIFLLQRHIIRHQERIHPCSICGLKFACKYERNTHEKRQHTESYKKFECDVVGCGAKFSTRRCFQMHYDFNHLGIRVSCEVPGCERQLSNRMSYVTHLRDVHKELEKSERAKYLEKIGHKEKPRIKGIGERQKVRKKREPKNTKSCKF